MKHCCSTTNLKFFFHLYLLKYYKWSSLVVQGQIWGHIWRLMIGGPKKHLHYYKLKALYHKVLDNHGTVYFNKIWIRWVVEQRGKDVPHMTTVLWCTWSSLVWQGKLLKTKIQKHVRCGTQEQKSSTCLKWQIFQQMGLIDIWRLTNST